MIGLISIANADAASVSSWDHQRVELHAERKGVARQRRRHLAVEHHHVRPLVLEPGPRRPGGPCFRQICPSCADLPEMLHPQHVDENWVPSFVDYFHFAFATATASAHRRVAVKPWMKLMMMAEEAISLVVAILVVARAVNILK